jgi:3-oxoacyl-[acyl-carrier protein] reductase
MLEKSFVLITGASGGIGQSIAKKLAKNGHSLYLHYYTNLEAILDLMKELRELNKDGEYIPIQADLRTEEGCQQLTHEIYQIQAIVHNSGIAVNKVLTTMLTEEIHDLITLHLTAPILITRSLLPKLIRQKHGAICFVSSIWGLTGASCETVYSAVKGGQISFAKALSKEVAPSGIRVNCVAPGAIQTDMLNNLNEEDLEIIKNEIPLERLGKPDEVADAVEYLLSDKASYITGQVISVNGGWYV